MPSPPTPIRIVLPHREGFGPGSAGAVAMVVRRFAAGGSRYPAQVIGPRFRGEGFAGIDFLPVDVPAWLPLNPTQSYAVTVARTLARLPPGPIEVHNKPDVALWLARFFPRRPVSLFLHNDPRTMRGARSPAARRRLLARLAAVATVSDSLRRALLDGVTAPPERAPVVIHNALDFAEVPVGLPPEAREPVILFAGRVVAEKAPDAFIAACARALPHLPGWRAEIIGAGGFSAAAPDSKFIRRLRPAAAAAGVRLLGFHRHAAVLEAMARAAIVVVPSRWDEPFGLTALEAMACGAALMSSGRGGLAEVGGDACLPFDPDDAGTSASTLRRLAGDAALRARLSAAGRERARALFDARDAVAKLDALRNGVVERWAGPAAVPPWPGAARPPIRGNPAACASPVPRRSEGRGEPGHDREARRETVSRP